MVHVSAVTGPGIRVHRYVEGDSVADCVLCRDPVGFSDADVPTEHGPVATAAFAPYVVAVMSDGRGRDVFSDVLCNRCADWAVQAGAALAAQGFGKDLS